MVLGRVGLQIRPSRHAEYSGCLDFVSLVLKPKNIQSLPNLLFRSSLTKLNYATYVRLHGNKVLVCNCLSISELFMRMVQVVRLIFHIGNPISG